MICGSECTDTLSCKCGNVETNYQSQYCCSNANCTKAANGDVTCSHGQILPFTQSCNHECPYKNEGNCIAISSTCDNNVGCPSTDWHSKICINSGEVKNKEFGSFCEAYYDEGISCSIPFNSKWFFDQCYYNNIEHIR